MLKTRHLTTRDYRVSPNKKMPNDTYLMQKLDRIEKKLNEICDDLADDGGYEEEEEE